MKQSSPSVACPLWQLQLPGAWLWGKQSRQSLLPGPPVLHSPGGPLPHSQPHPTHVKLMSSRPHTRADLMVLTYLIKTAASKYGVSAPRPQRRSRLSLASLDSGTVSTLSFFPPSSLLLSPDFSNICVQKGRKTLFGLASFHSSFSPPFKHLV